MGLGVVVGALIGAGVGTYIGVSIGEQASASDAASLTGLVVGGNLGAIVGAVAGGFCDVVADNMTFIVPEFRSGSARARQRVYAQYHCVDRNLESWMADYEAMKGACVSYDSPGYEISCGDFAVLLRDSDHMDFAVHSPRNLDEPKPLEKQERKLAERVARQYGLEVATFTGHRSLSFGKRLQLGTRDEVVEAAAAVRWAEHVYDTSLAGERDPKRLPVDDQSIGTVKERIMRYFPER